MRDTARYVTAPGNETLHAAVAHVPESSWPGEEAGPVTLPALGFVTFHRYDEALVTSRLRAALEAMRGRSPQDRLHCIVVGDMGDGLAAGMTVPFLLRVRDLLQHLKVHLEVVLVTSEAAAEGNAEAAARNCVAQAMLWEAAQAGEAEFAYPGKEGVREERCFRGPVAPTPYVFSGGVGDTRYGEAATASAVATCITTLLLTRLGDDLAHREAEADAATGESDAAGSGSPTIATLNVGGVELHAFPSLFRLRAVRSFLGALTRTRRRTRGRASGRPPGPIAARLGSPTRRSPRSWGSARGRSPATNSSRCTCRRKSSTST